MKRSSASFLKSHRTSDLPGIIILPALSLLVAVIVFPQIVEARVYITPEQALSQAFGDRYEKKRLHLYPSQKEAIEKKIGSEVRHRLYTIYVGYDASKRPIGYGLIHTEKVRTKEQTLFIVITPDEKVRDVILISFYEPDDYVPPDRWLRLLIGKSRYDRLTPGVDLPAISGATLTTRTTADSVKLAIALVPYAKQL